MTPLEDSYRFCHELTARTAGNFGYSFLTLDSQRRRGMEALYAFMRLTDDLSDDATLSKEMRKNQLKEWRALFQNRLVAPESHVLWPALSETITRFEIPERHFQTVITGVEMDLDPLDIQTFADLENYCYHVAGAVGLCCLPIWGCHREEATPIGIECGLAMQLTNILRDLGEDIDQGRVYLPREEMDRFRYRYFDLILHRKTEEFRQLMAFQVHRAEVLFDRSRELLRHLPRASRPVLLAMIEIYSGILRQIARRDFDVFSSRSKLSKFTKLSLAGKSIVLGRFLPW